MSAAELIHLWKLLPRREVAPEVLPLDWPELEDVLPDRGLPVGVVELSAPRALGGGTSISLAAMRSAQERDAQSYCAWVDPDATLYAPGVAMAGVDLSRLLVVRPPRERAGEVALRLASAHVFSVIVFDVPGVKKMEILVRKLALQAAQAGSTLVLLSDAEKPRQLPWPVSLRLELERRRGGIFVRVAKDKRGRNGAERLVALHGARL